MIRIGGGGVGGFKSLGDGGGGGIGEDWGWGCRGVGEWDVENGEGVCERGINGWSL